MTGVQAVYLDGQGVAGIDHRVVTPSSTQTYTLRVITQDGQEEFCPMTVEVPEPEIVKIKCDASPSTIQSGECSTLIWNITGVRDVYLEGRHGVAGVASQEVCLYQSQTFVLEIGLLDGSRTSCSMPVTVSTPVPPQPPIADFSANPREIYCGAEVHFTNLSTNANTYYWDFGDGHTSTEHNPIHEYVPSEGGVSYTVSLIAQGPTGTDGETKYDYVISSNCVR